MAKNENVNLLSPQYNGVNLEVQFLGSWIFTHGDVDGLCAGAIALAAYPDANVFFTHPYGLEGDLCEAKMLIE